MHKGKEEMKNKINCKRQTRDADDGSRLAEGEAYGQLGV